MPELELDLYKTSPSWLEERTILLALTGSHAYGTNVENSDRDFRGVCIPPVEYYLGLNSFNEYNTSGGKNFKNTKDDVDVNVIHVNKFVRDAMNGVPNNIEILFTRPEDYLTITPLGQKLIDNRHLFLSQQIKNKFGDYANSQMQKLKNQRSNGSARGDLVEAFGYDTKFFAHAIRLLSSAIEILVTGDFHTYRQNRELLLDCRGGKFTFEEALEMMEMYDVYLGKALERTELPKKPDYDKINELLIEVNKVGLIL